MAEGWSAVFIAGDYDSLVAGAEAPDERTGALDSAARTSEA
jgi:hypothetical protein